MSEPTRFLDSGITLNQFSDNILVVCTVCRNCAVVRQICQGVPSGSDPPVCLICAGCGQKQEWINKLSFSSEDSIPRDPFFHATLWLQTPCCGRTLWAFNGYHLKYLQQFVSATLRQRRCDPESGWKNSSLISRLPGWIKSAKNRASVLKGIAKLETMLP